jgi:hypothetical protein
MFTVNLKHFSFSSINMNAIFVIVIINIISLSFSSYAELCILRCGLHFYCLFSINERAGNFVFLVLTT